MGSIFLIALKTIMSLVMLIVWVFPRNFKCVGMGGFFGKIINIGNNMLSYIQDRLVEMMVRETVCRNIESVSRELLIK